MKIKAVATPSYEHDRQNSDMTKSVVRDQQQQVLGVVEGPEYKERMSNSREQVVLGDDETEYKERMSNSREQVVLGDDETEYKELHVAAREQARWGIDNEGMCRSTVVQKVGASVDEVWKVVRRFEKPEAYKQFIRSCSIVTYGADDDMQVTDESESAMPVGVGSTREVSLVSGLPARKSRERLELLDDVRHVTSFRVIGGDHRLSNYRSVTSLHAHKEETEETDMIGNSGTVVVESYEVDVPEGNTCEDTRTFADTIVRSNLHSLNKHLTHVNKDALSSPPNSQRRL